MNEESVMKIFFSYLREKIKVIAMMVIFLSIFILVYYLYNVNLEPIAYAAILCMLLAVIFTIIDFTYYYKKHMELLNLRNKIIFTIDELPIPKTQIESDYKQFVEILYCNKNEIQSNSDNIKTNLIEYCTMWAHQIKTPIAAMRLFMQCNENEGNKELSLELFKIEQYVEMILQYIKLDDMGNDLLLKEYDIDNIIRQVVRKYAKIFITKKISINYEPLNIKVITDEKWLVFVIEQIISNALKYTKEGSISIYLDDKREKTLVIEDTGIGIEAEDLPRVCEKGFTGYNGREDKKSTGIGLYLCKEILKKLSHKLYIESEVGRGTKFYIDLTRIKMDIE